MGLVATAVNPGGGGGRGYTSPIFDEGGMAFSTVNFLTVNIFKIPKLIRSHTI